MGKEMVMRSVIRFGFCAALGLVLSGATQPAEDVVPEQSTATADQGEAFDKAFATEKNEAQAQRLTKGDPVTREFLVGIWAEPGKSCEAGIDFQADGKMIGPFPRWELEDGQLTMIGNRQKMRLTVVDKNTMQSRRSETDPPRTLKRCPKALPPPQP